MNCNAMERKILLLLSGELSEADSKKLHQHLAVCAQCRAFKKSAMDIVDTVSNSLSVEEPSAGVLEGILSEAEKTSAKSRVFQFPLHALELMACAAVLVLVAGGVLLFSGDGSSERIDELSAIIAVISDNKEEISDEGALDDLATQLLQLQGFMDYDAIEIQYQDAAQSPTALQLRSNRALLLKECV